MSIFKEGVLKRISAEKQKETTLKRIVSIYIIHILLLLHFYAQSQGHQNDLP